MATDYPPEFWIKYLAVCLEEYYGVKIRLDKKLHPHCASNNYIQNNSTKWKVL